MQVNDSTKYRVLYYLNAPSHGHLQFPPTKKKIYDGKLNSINTLHRKQRMIIMHFIMTYHHAFQLLFNVSNI